MIAVLVFVAICGAAATAFLLWCVWDLCWSVYDGYMQDRKRKANARFDARVGRDAYRFTKGVHR